MIPSEIEAAPTSPTRAIVQVLLIILGVIAALWALHRVASVVIVLMLAALFAYVIAPLVQLAERPIRIAGRRRHLPRAAAIALVYVVIAGSVAAGVALLLPSATRQVGEMIASAPAYTQSVLTWERGWTRYYERLRMPPELRDQINESVLAADEGIVQWARGWAMTMVGTLSDLPWLVLIPILAFFFLKDAATLRRTIIIALPFQTRLRGYRVFEELNATLAAYVRAQLLACVLVGSVCGFGFAVLDIPYPVLLGVLAGILEFIPVVGPLLLATVASIVAALHAPGLALRAVGFLAILRVIEDYIVYPRLIGRGIEIHPLAVIVAVLTGAELDGLAGMFFAVPIVAIASVLFRHWLEWRAAQGAATDEPAS